MGIWIHLCLFLLSTILHANCQTDEESLAERADIVGKIIPKPIKKWFGGGSSSGEDRESAKEQGNLDFWGRDLLRTISTTFSKVGKKFGFSSEEKKANSESTILNGINAFRDQLRAIYPGTLWCGAGNKAKDYNQLGIFAEADKCCREHDHCTDTIDAGKTKYGLQNTGLFTRSLCDCDENFYNCLKRDNSIIARDIGNTYFNVLGPQCFKPKEPRIPCISGVCKEQPPILGYKWQDNKKF